MNHRLKLTASGLPEVPAAVRAKAAEIEESGGRPGYYVNKHGQVGVMNTANIGRRKAPRPRATVQDTSAALRARILHLETELAAAQDRIAALLAENETLSRQVTMG